MSNPSLKLFCDLTPEQNQEQDKALASLNIVLSKDNEEKLKFIPAFPTDSIANPNKCMVCLKCHSNSEDLICLVFDSDIYYNPKGWKFCGPKDSPCHEAIKPTLQACIVCSFPEWSTLVKEKFGQDFTIIRASGYPETDWKVISGLGRYTSKSPLFFSVVQSQKPEKRKKVFLVDFLKWQSDDFIALLWSLLETNKFFNF